MKPLVGRCLLLALLVFPAAVHAADTVEVALVLPRTHYGRDGLLDEVLLAVRYHNDGGNLDFVPLEIRNADGRGLALRVPFGIVKDMTLTQVVSLRTDSLEPGDYTATVRAGAASRSTSFRVHSSPHNHTFAIGQWNHHGETRGTTLAKGGWMYFNTDLATMHPRRPKPGDIAEWYVEAGMRPFARMVLGGGHQLDLDLQNDWGDPWVQRTIAWRMQLAAQSNRIYPIAGLHCYDEPGLTWWPIPGPDGKPVETNPFAIPHQLEEFTRLTGKRLPVGRFADTAPQYARRMDDWLDFMDLRMKYLEQAWHATVWGTASAAPRFVTINQVSSSYAPGTTTDGVDSRQNRPYTMVSGHGGYSDMPYGTLQPVRSAEGFRGFTWDRPHVFLPMWYTHTWATMRNAVWVALATKLDGMFYTPEQDFGMDNSGRGYDGSHTVLEVAELNRRMAIVGPVFRDLPKTPSPVAVLHSHRQFAHDLATFNHPEVHKIGSPQYVSPHRDAVDACFFRVLEQGILPNWIDEVEAAEKGAVFLKPWPVILCPRLATAAPKFRAALEQYIAGGGKLIQFEGDKLRIPGSVVVAHGFGSPSAYFAERCEKDGGILSPHYRDLAWRKWNNDLAPTFAADLSTWIGPQAFACENKEVLLGISRKGKATYLIFANNAQSRDNPRGLKHELIPTETAVRLPATGVVYDLLHGGVVRVNNGRGQLRLAAGDGTVWVHLPEEPKVTRVPYQPSEKIVTRDGPVFPVRRRLIDPAGNRVHEQFVGAELTLPEFKGPGMEHGVHSRVDAPGTWRREYYIAALDRTIAETIEVTGENRQHRQVELGDTTFSSLLRIQKLLAGKAEEPPYELLNTDARRVFGLDPRRFAIFGPAPFAERLAEALRAKGMTVAVNPPYELKPFVREPGRGGAGVSHGVASNLEDIRAHTIVFSGHPLFAKAQERGHFPYEANAAWPGPNQAFLHPGISCFQPGWHNVFVLGNPNAGVSELLSLLRGEPLPTPKQAQVSVQTAPARKPPRPVALAVTQTVACDDTPVGIGASPDGAVVYTLRYDGLVTAHDRDGKQRWNTQALLEGCQLAVSPHGDRLAVAGYPGLLVLDAASGRVLGGFRADPVTKAKSLAVNRMVAVAWNTGGTLAAGGWINPDPSTGLEAVVVDAHGQVVARPKVAGQVFGAAFVPGTDTLLLGADTLTAIHARDGRELWKAPVKGAQSFAFHRDGKTGAAGGWGKTAATFALADGKIAQAGSFPSVVGGVAFLPDGALAVAVWGGTWPLFALRGGKAEALHQSRFGFQNVAWSEHHGGLVAAEQGGKVWLLDAKGTPRALLDEDHGTTAYRLIVRGEEVLVARMNRVVQRVASR